MAAAVVAVLIAQNFKTPQQDPIFLAQRRLGVSNQRIKIIPARSVRPLTVINAFIKPLVQLLSLPLLILTLGLFTLVINALMLMLTSWITETTEFGISVDGFWTAVWGALIISIVNFVLTAVVPSAKR